MFPPAIARELVRARQQELLQRPARRSTRVSRETGTKAASIERPRSAAFSAVRAAARLQPRGQ
jgi:hypothetical protein